MDGSAARALTARSGARRAPGTPRAARGLGPRIQFRIHRQRSSSFPGSSVSLMICLLLALVPTPDPLGAVPQLPDFEYPPTEIDEELDGPIVAVLSVDVYVTREGRLSRLDLVESAGIPEERVKEFMAWFRKQLVGQRVEPPVHRGRPADAVFTHAFSWILAEPPPPPTPTPGAPVPSTGPGRRILLGGSGISIEQSAAGEIVVTADGRRLSPDEYRRELDSRARSLMNENRTEYIKGRTAIIISDHGSKVLLDYCMSAITATQGTFFEVFEPLLPPKLSIKRPIAYIFKSQDSYESFRDTMGVSPWADGNYMGSLRIMSVHTDTQDIARIRAVLVHETIHYLVHEILLPERRAPMWFNEGLAQYFENSSINNRGRMLYGIVDHALIAPLPSAKIPYSGGSRDIGYLLGHRSELEGGLVESLVRGERNAGDESTTDQVRVLYATAFALTNMLLGNVKDGIQPSYHEYVRDLRRGEDPVAAFTERFGDFGDVESRLWEHVRGM